MTLGELLHDHPKLFYHGNRQWWQSERFLNTYSNHMPPKHPDEYRMTKLSPRSLAKLDRSDCELAVDLAASYVLEPTHPMFREFLPCRDVDHLGQQVLVGATRNGAGLELHRVLDYGNMLWHVVAK